MKPLKFLWALAILAISTSAAIAQDAEQIIDNYLETIGGVDNWNKLTGIKFIGKGIQQGQEFPGYMIMLKDGRQIQAYDIQGKTMKDNVFDGNTLWSTNFQNLKAEKASSEQTNNFKLDANDFPDPFLNYKEKGYTLELLGSETIDGVETHKIKLTKEPHTVDGQKVDDVVFYYFDTDSNVPIAMEVELKSGPAKGQMYRTTMSDYQEVEGLYFAFTTTESIGQQEIITIALDAVELNPTVEDALFTFPENEE
ncbi:MAG: outer membrane lipoprotein-sorting protein [Allomuricauda sp.]|nr:MAG: outer membrane lipoprotein-sorting protein [Allomuricauda sp.]